MTEEQDQEDLKSQTECLELCVSMNEIQLDELSTKVETISNMENDVTEKTIQTSAETKRMKQEEVKRLEQNHRRVRKCGSSIILEKMAEIFYC